MKNLSKLFLAVLLSVAFFSCSDDDNDYAKSDLKGFYQRETLVDNLVVKTSNEEVTKAVKRYILTDLDYEGVKDFGMYFDGNGAGTEWKLTENRWAQRDEFEYNFSGNKLSIIYSSYEDAVDTVPVEISSTEFKVKVDDTEYYNSKDGYNQLSYIIEDAGLDIDPASITVNEVSMNVIFKKVSDKEPI